MKGGWPVEAAVHDAMSHFGLSRKSVFARMQRFKKRMESYLVSLKQGL